MGASRHPAAKNAAPMKALDDFRLRLGGHELVPIMIGGMGVDISSSDLALEAARLGGVGHISDAMIKTVTDRRYKTKYVKAKQAQYKYNVDSPDKSVVKFNLGDLAEATRLHVEHTMSRKTGSGLVFINCMEKLTMNAPKETLAVRLASALDAGIDGVTLAAGLHLQAGGGEQAAGRHAEQPPRHGGGAGHLHRRGQRGVTGAGEGGGRQRRSSRGPVG